MSISSIFSNSATDPLSQLYAPTSAASTTGVTSTQDPDGDGSASSVSAAATSISGGAKLLKQLQDLQKSDPAEFKKVTADIAAQLQTAAQQEGGSQGAALTSLANKFSQASQTGDLSALQSGHHHGGHHHAASDSSTSSATSAAIAAYQQAGGQSDPLTSAQSTGAGTSLRAQVSGIISQVLTTDLGNTTASTATGTSV